MNPVTGWYNETTLHPLGVLALLVLGTATLLVPRRYALVPALLMACLVAPAQRIVVATLDFNFVRMMIVFGLLRVLIRGEHAGFRWKPLDMAVVAWSVCSLIAGTLLFASGAGFINRLGFFYDAIGLYFLCRFVIRDWRDVLTFTRSAAVIVVPVAMLFLVEKATGRNLFAFFGGVPEETIERAGKLRCQGPFVHSILAGSFFAALMPIVASLWWSSPRDRMLAVGGVVSCATIVVACASATPLGAALAGVMAALLLPARHWMSWVRWGSVAGLVALQAVMANPLWHLLARVPLVSGATGWYRYKLIDEFVRHFPDWALIGTRSYTNWPGPGFDAITNEYVRQGVGGGLLTLVLFVTIIVLGFVGIGRICRRAAALGLKPAVPMAWMLGVALFVHCVAFIGVSYYGQVLLMWYFVLGCIGSLAPIARRVPITSSPPPRNHRPAIPPLAAQASP